MSTTPNTAVVAVPSAALPPNTGKQVVAKSPAKPVVKSIVKPAVVKTIQPALKKPALSKPAATKSPLAKSPLAKIPAVKNVVVKKVAVKPAATKALPLAKDKKAVKTKKPKLVRDSFTIPKAEYVVLEALKQRATKLTRPAKKSELLRAGIKALASLSDAAFLTALGQVPTIKTGRPTLAR